MGDGDVRMDRCWRVNGFAEDLHKIGVSIVRQYVRVPQSEATLPRLLLFWSGVRSRVYVSAERRNDFNTYESGFVLLAPVQLLFQHCPSFRTTSAALLGLAAVVTGLSHLASLAEHAIFKVSCRKQGRRRVNAAGMYVTDVM